MIRKLLCRLGFHDWRWTQDETFAGRYVTVVLCHKNCKHCPERAEGYMVL